MNRKKLIEAFRLFEAITTAAGRRGTRPPGLTTEPSPIAASPAAVGAGGEVGADGEWTPATGGHN